METLRQFLLAQKGWQDEKGNTVVFSAKGLTEEPTEEEFWIFLDEGLRCGGMHRKILPEASEIRKALLGCGKRELWEQIEKDIANLESEENPCFQKN